MNPKLRLILIILGIILLVLLIPKPYSYSYGSDCHPYPSGGKNSGLCIGIIYPINEENQKTPDRQYPEYRDEREFCTDTKKGFECKGFPIFKFGISMA